MIKFFRKIRQKLLTENKFSKYVLYAIGEIALVMIGILLALQVNNWNNAKQEKTRLYDSYKSILNEINFVKSRIEEQNIRNDSTVVSLKKCLKLLKEKNSDSINQLAVNLRGLVKLNKLSFDFPVTLGFIENVNQENIENKNLRKSLQSLKSEISFLNGFHNYAVYQYQNLIEPFVVKKLNYSTLHNQEKLVNINHSIDYSIFIEDLELANILNLKLETDLKASEKLNELINLTKQLNNEIQKEILNK